MNGYIYKSMLEKERLEDFFDIVHENAFIIIKLEKNKYILILKRKKKDLIIYLPLIMRWIEEIKKKTPKNKKKKY